VIGLCDDWSVRAKFVICVVTVVLCVFGVFLMFWGGW